MAVKIDGYLIDAAPLEQHGFNSTVTSHPVEKGADITDHVVVQPETVTLECIVSDTPIGDAADARDGGVPSAEVFARLIAIRDAREPVEVETSLTTFSNMILESLSIPTRDGDALNFRASFKQLVLIEADRTKRVEVPRAAKKQHRGDKPSKEVKDGWPPTYSIGRKESVAHGLAEKLGH